MNVFSLSSISLSSSYSADYHATSGTYIQNLGTGLTDGTTSVSFSGHAPFLNLSVSAVNLSAGLWLNPISACTIDWNDVFDYPSTTTSLFSSFSASVFRHFYTVPGTYDVDVTVYPSNTAQSTSAFEAATITLSEIQAAPTFTVFQNGSLFVYGASAYEQPLTVQFCTSGTKAGSYLPEAVVWNFGDGDKQVVSLYEPSSANTFFTLNSADPRNYVISHTYSRLLSSSQTTFTPVLSTISQVTGSTLSVSGSAIGPLNLLAARKRRLIKNRMFNANDDLLFVFEDATTNQTFMELISATNNL